MRFLLVGVAFVLIALAVIPLSRAARADNTVHVFHISCLPEINLFEIRSLGFFEGPHGLATGTNYDLTTKGYALYSPEWAYYQLDKPSKEVEEKFGVPFAFYATRFECRLRTEAVVLVVLPHLAHSYEGTAGDISVTLGLTGRWVIEGLPFHLCEDRGPITRLFYDGDERIVELEGRFGGVWPDKISSDEIMENARRGYRFNGSTLSVWDSISRALQALPGPLTAKDIDYYQDPSSESYGEPVADCL